MEDEHYRNDFNGTRVRGFYDIEGHFVIDVPDRDYRGGRNDIAGYMLDSQGRRIQD